MDRYPPNQSPSSSSAVAVIGGAEEEEREQMFEKVVTPSDVGKLNRLVIPKQHAERYFPLDPASNDKGGLHLSFEEDRTGGRPWRFRYSYWNSSQSYVMTKGWSRFVKDKRLDPGDTVAFSRAPVSGRLFIDWRRRPSLAPPLLLRSTVVPAWWGWGHPHPPFTDTNNNHYAAATTTSTYFQSVGPTLPPPRYAILDSVPVPASCSADPKRVRLFGVNLDCTERGRADQYLQPPSPLQWRLSPSPKDQDGADQEGSF